MRARAREWVKKSVEQEKEEEAVENKIMLSFLLLLLTIYIFAGCLGTNLSLLISMA